MPECEVDIRKQAREQRAQHNWSAAAISYEKIYSPQSNCWLAWEYADCLKKLSRLDDAIAVSKDAYQRNREFAHNNNFLSWLLYEKYFKHPQTNYDYNELNHLYEITLSITTFTTQDGKGSYEITIIQMLKLLKKYGNNPAPRILNLLDKLDVNKLSSEAGIYEQNGKEKKFQSPKEMFYAMKSKALLDTNHYAECRTCCDEAMKALEQFHHDNKVWIIARKAVSVAHGGDPDNAILELKNALAHKNHWSLLEKMAEIYLIKNDQSNALLYFSMAAISNDSPKMKVTLYMSIANLLYSMGDNENAWRHLCFTKDIREKEGWAIPATMQTLQEKLAHGNFGCNVLHEQLKQYWLQNIYHILGKRCGKVNRINRGGKTGFISSAGKSYFFRTQSFIDRVNPREGDIVSFCLVDSFDEKKQCESLACDYISVDKKDEK